MAKKRENSASLFYKMTNLAHKNNAINLSQGIPENIFDSDWNTQLLEKTGEAWQYSSTKGIEGLRRAVSSSYNMEGFEQAVITSGCTESLFCSLITWRNRGYKKVIALEPFYPYYLGMASLIGLNFDSVPIINSRDVPGLDLDLLVKKVKAEKTIIIINSPHNPSGYVIKTTEWEELLALSHRFNSAILVDDVYREFNYDGHVTPYKELCENNVLIAGSLSKSLAATGVRIGWLVGKGEAFDEAHDAHSHMSHCQPKPLQSAAHEIMKKNNSSTRNTIKESYRKKRDLLTNTLNSGGIKFIHPSGGHFVMAKINNRDMGRIKTSLEQCEELIKKAGVAALPLDTFYRLKNPEWIRFSFSLDFSSLEEACFRLEQYFMEYKQ